MILINGTEGDAIDINDRGLQYGDGVFETIAVQGGRPRCWERHLQRLAVGCRRLGIPVPQADLLRWDAELVCAGADRAVLKLMVTRGSGGRGYRPPRRPEPTRIVALHEWPRYPADNAVRGIELRICATRWSVNPALAGIKHLNRLEQVLARAEWDDPRYAEGLMLSTADEVISGTMSNLFVVRGGVLQTPDLSHCGIEGITRRHILELSAASALPSRIVPLRMADLRQADELFLCNSVFGVWPVRRLGRCTYDIGPESRRLAEAVALWQDKDECPD